MDDYLLSLLPPDKMEISLRADPYDDEFEADLMVFADERPVQPATTARTRAKIFILITVSSGGLSARFKYIFVPRR